MNEGDGEERNEAADEDKDGDTQEKHEPHRGHNKDVQAQPRNLWNKKDTLSTDIDQLDFTNKDGTLSIATSEENRSLHNNPSDALNLIHIKESPVHDRQALAKYIMGKGFAGAVGTHHEDI